ncbi:hypothetical protein [Herbaspirillum rubrisubalbicans]|uniref:Uncharacterized protein n=1 Tax=Herbaspirillum rubrisubalbicans TaxID=80842 RepID=A0AAD0XFX8_9BURK|nr:hypothetical protein [Herbaspirillum rubrisubalbicans]AYR24681.1 hypothetical protein RC54_12970 [Herbaspirillum rubrisubalbicans]
MHITREITQADVLSPTREAASTSAQGGAGAAISISLTPPSASLIEIVQQEQSSAQELADLPLASAAETARAGDIELQQILSNYLHVKNRPINPEHALAFVREQQMQLAKPQAEQDWTRAQELYLQMQHITSEEFERVVGGVFKGGWVGSGTVYALSSQLGNFLSVLPSIYTASVPREDLKNHPVHYALVNLCMQVGFSLITPMINAAIQIPMVARQELMRAKGQPARSKEMRAPLYPETRKQLIDVTREMEQSAKRMEEHSRVLDTLERDSPAWSARVDEMQRDGDAAVGLMQQHMQLQNKFQVRKEVTELNYVSQYYLAWNRVLRVAGTLAGQISGTAMGNAHLSAYIQIGTAVLTMGLQQFWAGPKGQLAKQSDTLLATLRSTRLIRPEQQAQLEAGQLNLESLGPEHLDLSDVPRQWTRGEEVALGQFKEYLSLHIQYLEQEMADMLGMNPHEWRALVANRDDPEAGEGNRLALNEHKLDEMKGGRQRYEALGAQLTQLKADKAHVQADNWLSVSPENRAILLRSVDGKHDWETAVRTAWVRMRLPSDFIPQVAQRVGAQFQMVFAGSNMPLVVSALLRMIQAESTEAHRHAVQLLAQAPAPVNNLAPVLAAAPTVAATAAPVVSNGGRFAIASVMSLIGVAGAFSSGALVNDKITQRSEMREDAKRGETPRVGFQPGLTARALKAIGRSMFALPTAVKKRVQIEYTARSARHTQAQLQQRLDQARLLADGNS